MRTTDLAAFDHQDLPFERLVDIVNPVRSTSHHPLFQVTLVLQNNADAVLKLPGLAVSAQSMGSEIAKFDLSFAFSEKRACDGTPVGLDVEIEYACDLFDRRTVESLAKRLVRLFAMAAAHADVPVGSFDLLEAEERQTLIHDWNETAHAVADTPLAEMFEQQVAKTPDRTALVFEDVALTYTQLNARANQLADHLIAQGIGPEHLVAIALPRCVEMIVSMLAVLKAGAGYLPLDPHYPAQRLSLMLEDSPPTVDTHLQACRRTPAEQHRHALSGRPGSHRSVGRAA